MRRLSLLLPLFLTLPGLSEEPPDSEEAAYPALDRFVQVLEQVRQRHPDVDRLAYERLVNHALEGMLASLDPHSSFIHPEMAAILEEEPDFEPHVPSLGLTIGWSAEGPRVAGVKTGWPADELPVGAKISEIDGEPANGVDPRQLIARLRGAPGQTTRLTVLPPDAPRPREVELTHRLVEDRAVTDARLLEDVDPATGYVRLASFTAAAPRETEAALDELEDAGMARLVLDLRGNPGGSLPATVDILGLFVPPATEVVTVRARDADPEAMVTDERKRRRRDYPVTVLIDRQSASASELTAGALQDLDRAVVVGETSYGKGSVQNIIPMGHGTALRLTVATYHTPSGRTPHLNGVEPDVSIELSEEDRENAARFRRRATLPEDEAEALERWTDPVLRAALEAFEADAGAGAD